MTDQDLKTAAITVQLSQWLIDFCDELDHNYGMDATRYFTEDCIARSGTISFDGHDGARKYYEDRLAFIRANQRDGTRTSRHTPLRLRVSIEADDRASLKFLMVTFAGEGAPPVADATTPVAISDTHFVCRRGGDGQWRIAGFYGTPTFISPDPFALKALMGR